MLLSGRVHLGMIGPSGKQGILSTIGAVIAFGEMAGVDRGVKPMTAVAFEAMRANCQQPSAGCQLPIADS